MEWDPLLIDLRHTRGQRMLFRQTVQLYSVMKKMLARAMTVNWDLKESPQTQQEWPNLKDIKREIQIVQGQ